MKGWVKIFHANDNRRRAGVALLLSDKMHLKSKTITRDKKKALCNNKSVNIKKVVTITNIYAHNFRTPKHIKKTLTERSGKIDTNKIILGDFNIPLSIMYTTTRQNINKKIVDLNNTTNQIDLIDMYKTVHTTA